MSDENIPCTFSYKGIARAGSVQPDGGRYILRFGYHQLLVERVKLFAGRKWLDKQKAWAVPANERNEFQLKQFMGKPVYDIYNTDYKAAAANIAFKRNLFKHQREDLVSHGLTMRYGIWAAEMGCGKTLSDIELLEHIFVSPSGDTNGSLYGPNDVWFVAPRSALVSVQLEFEKWKAKGTPRFMTYEGMTKAVATWPPGAKPPRVVIFDEGSRLKTWSTQRTQAANHLVASIRREWGMDGAVIIQTGTPSPKSPVDWWSLTEILRPGFLIEGEPHFLQSRVGIVKMEEHSAGHKYPKVLGWRDSVDKCAACAGKRDDSIHDIMAHDYHPFVPCVNEVERLFGRMKGLVSVVLKKHCLDLPDKQYVVHRLKPEKSLLRAAQLVTKTAPRAADALIRLRELCDGFQYEDHDTGEQSVCTCCHGQKEIHAWFRNNYPSEADIEQALHDGMHLGLEVNSLLSSHNLEPTIGNQVSVLTKHLTNRLPTNGPHGKHEGLAPADHEHPDPRSISEADGSENGRIAQRAGSSGQEGQPSSTEALSAESLVQGQTSERGQSEAGSAEGAGAQNLSGLSVGVRLVISLAVIGLAEDEVIIDLPPAEPFMETKECPVCQGSGFTTRIERKANTMACPKDQVLIDLLEEHEEVGRFVVFAGFQASVDRVERICLEQGWTVLRTDGKATTMRNPDGTPFTFNKRDQVGAASGNSNDIFREGVREFQLPAADTAVEKMVYVANPATGSTGLTLTRSPSILFFSNSFNGEDRTQAEDRIHRPGMDASRGATIHDIVLLPADELVINNLKAKRKLELMTLGELKAASEAGSDEMAAPVGLASLNTATL